MINGFDMETAPLSDYEMNVIVPTLAVGLRRKVGKAMAVTSTQMIDGMNRIGKKISGPRLRKCINYIRISGLVKCLLATSDGYYVAESEDEITEYESSLLGRELAIREVRECLIKQKKEVFG